MYKDLKNIILLILITLIILLSFNYYFILITNIQEEIIRNQLSIEKEILIKQIALKTEKIKIEKQAIKIMARVTAFNTVIYQTDNNPCMAKFGYICNRNDVVACPRNIPAHTKVKILNKEYECMDWTAEKYNGRFDICFGKNIKGAKQFGIKYLEITIYKKM